MQSKSVEFNSINLYHEHVPVDWDQGEKSKISHHIALLLWLFFSHSCIYKIGYTLKASDVVFFC